MISKQRHATAVLGMLISPQHVVKVLCLATLFLLTTTTVTGAPYAGFDCGQGSAVLVLASHKCHSEVHQHVLSCFNSLALRVKRCNIKAWPHPHHGRKQACWGVQLLANVTDVNQAQGTLHLHGSGQHVPVQLEYRRPDEAMHIRIGAAPAAAPQQGGGSNGGSAGSEAAASCTFLFDVRSASEASLHPIPGEDVRSLSSLVAVLLPAILVPCVCVGLIMALGSLSATAQGGGAGSFMQAALVSMTGRGGGMEAADDNMYEQLAASDPDSSTGPSAAAAGGRRRGGGTGNSPGGLGLLKAMSRRARSRRVRRSCRPAYVGLPEQSAQQHREYVSGRLQPGPFNLVAPFFKFPPVAMPPALEAIPESSTPTSGSRASSSHNLSLSVASSDCGDQGRTSPALDMDELLLLAPDSGHAPAGVVPSGSSTSLHSPPLLPDSSEADSDGRSGGNGGGGELSRSPPAWMWGGQLVVDAEQGGARTS